MNSRERFFARFEGKQVDRIPNLCITMGYGAQYIGASLRDYLLDYKTLVKSNYEVAKDFKIDILQTLSDPFRETDDFGANITYPIHEQPHCDLKFLQSVDDIYKLEIPDPFKPGRMLDRINAVKTMKENYGTEYPVMGWIEGPFAELGDLRGVSEIMMDMYDTPKKVKDLAEVCMINGIKFAKAQVEAGADIIGIGDALVSLLGPSLYDEIVKEFHLKLFKEIKDMGAICRLHICGDITSILEPLSHSGADIIDLDWMVDYKLATDTFENRVCPNGNFDPVSVLLYGNPSIIKRSIKDIVEVGGERSFVMAGCETPLFTPTENLMAVHEALVEIGQK